MPLITATSTRRRTLSPVCVQGHPSRVSGDCPHRLSVPRRGGSGSFESEGIGDNTAAARRRPHCRHAPSARACLLAALVGKSFGFASAYQSVRLSLGCSWWAPGPAGGDPVRGAPGGPGCQDDQGGHSD